MLLPGLRKTTISSPKNTVNYVVWAPKITFSLGLAAFWRQEARPNQDIFKIFGAKPCILQCFLLFLTIFRDLRPPGAARRPQEPPRRPQEPPRSPPGAPQEPPRSPQEGPGGAQENSKKPQAAPRAAQGAPRKPPEGPQEAPVNPRRPPEDPRSPEKAPKSPQEATNTAPRPQAPDPTSLLA